MDARRWRRLLALAESVTDATARGLPPALREKASQVPVIFEPWISQQLVESGLDPDLLGLFVGDSHEISESLDPMPPQIFLFLESIWESVDADEGAFQDEVRVTYLHELGHYLGLDELDLESRGLD